MKKQILLGTKNQAKINIVLAAVEPLSLRVLTLDDLGITIDVREDGRSTEENAEKKARAYFAASNIPTLAIDGGLRIEKLPEEKQPGVFIRRIHGADRAATDEEVLAYYVGELAKVGGESVGTWKGSIALAISDETVFCDGYSFSTILTTKRRGSVTRGAPLDAVTMDPATSRYYTEMDWRERPDAKWVYELLRRHVEEL